MHAIKSLGQNFLIRPEIAREIVALSHISAADVVWEIGPGHGILTRELVKTGCRLVAYELDRRLREPLEKEFGNSLRLVVGDVLKADWGAELTRAGQSVKIVANIPYNITSPLLAKLEQHCESFDQITLMVQKEVAGRICAEPGTKAYGVMTLRLKRVFTAKILLQVGKECFEPVPQIDSTVISLTRRQDPPQFDEPARYLRLISAAFAQRRKTLRNNLGVLVGRDKLDQLQSESGIDLNRRGETLSEEEFIHLCRFF